MSELDAGLLARHARLLLRFYPAAYRAHRGEEIFGTLLETTRPGRGWPPAREVASVIGGGLRARRAANLGQGLGASLRHVGILAAAMSMVQTPAALLLVASLPIGGQHFRLLPGYELGASGWTGGQSGVRSTGVGPALLGLAVTSTVKRRCRRIRQPPATSSVPPVHPRQLCAAGRPR